MLPAAAVVLAGPTLLAFFDGGFFAGPRLVALIAAWLVAAAVVVRSAEPLPRRPAGLLAVGGLAGLAAWTGLSSAWAPLAGPAGADLERLLLYLGAFVAAIGALRHPAARRHAEPALAAGALLVVGAGLAGRFVPGLVDLPPSASAAGRLDQPLTYWNAMGAMAALGLVLCAHIAGDRTRPVPPRMLAAAAAAPLGCGLYLTFSRGAIAALAGGLVILLVLAPTWTQLRAAALCVEGGLFAAAAAAALPAVRTLDPGAGDRDAQGAAALALVLAVALVCAAVQAWAARDERAGRTREGRLPLPRHTAVVAGVLVAAIVAVPVLFAAGTDAPRGATNERLTATSSSRDEYWAVALRSFAEQPVQGVGSGGFAAEWLRERDDGASVARDAHSLPVETLAELGLIGFTLLLAFAGGIAACARRAWLDDPAAAAGPAAGLAVWALHACLDWDWEMPALTLVALALAGLLVGRADGPRPDPPDAAHAAASGQ